MTLIDDLLFPYFRKTLRLLFDWWSPRLDVISTAKAEIAFSFTILSESGTGREYAHADTKSPPMVTLRTVSAGEAYQNGLIDAQGDVTTGLVVDASSSLDVSAKTHGDSGFAEERGEATLTFHNTDGVGGRVAVHYLCEFSLSGEASTTANPNGQTGAYAECIFYDDQMAPLAQFALTATPGRTEVSPTPATRSLRIDIPADVTTKVYTLRFRTRAEATVR